MSNKSVSNKSVSNKSTSFYCKVCCDSGKSEAEYRSHNTRETRDPNSKITCPILLALECRYCHKNGHTVKYCPSIKNKNREESNASKKTVSQSKTISQPVANSKSNIFDYLLEEEKIVPEEEYGPRIITPTHSKLNFASALAKPVEIEVKAKSIPIPVQTVKKSWVQMNMESDTEDEDYEEQEQVQVKRSWSQMNMEPDTEGVEEW